MSCASAWRAAHYGRSTVAGLLRLLGSVPRSDLLPFVTLMGLNAGLLVVQSVLLGRVVETLRTAAAGSDSMWVLGGPLAGLVAALVAGAVVQSGAAVAATKLERSVDGRVRHTVRTALGAEAELSSMENPAVQRDATAAREGAHNILLGAAAVDVVRVVFQYLNAILLALVILRASALAAVLVVLATFATRVLGINLGVRRLVPRLSANGLEQKALYLRGLVMSAQPAKETRLFGTGPWLIDRMTATWNAFYAPMFAVRRRHLWQFTLLYLSFAVAYVAALVPLVNAALSARVGLEPFVAALSAAAAMLPSLAQSYTRYLHVGEPVRAYERLLLRRSPAVVVRQGDVLPAGTPVSEIRLEQVVFTYPGMTRRVFDGLSLTLRVGESVGLVGINGAGKTTLVKLLSGLYLPQAGKITVDGIDLSAVDRADWSARLAVVFQDFVHYEMSMAENITFGRLTAGHDDQAIQEVIGWADLDQVVRRLPSGLDTPLSTAYTGGTDLSGGEWQRIALARALYALRGGAKLLILDEPTAAFDVRAEEQLFSRFLELTHGRTTLLISHRLSGVRRAHRIVVLDDGRIIEDGSHAELLALNGKYAKMFSTQASGIRDGQYDVDLGAC